MFIGHGMLAFAIAASVASVVGWDPRRATIIGLLAGAFATLPDVDIAYALVGLILGFEGIWAINDVLWESANVHRGVTHALPVAIVSGMAFAGLGWNGWSHSSSYIAAASLLTLILFAGIVGGPIIGGILGLFVVVGLAMVVVADALDVGARNLGLAAGLGLVTHPFGDFFTGSPPALFWPFDPPLELGLVVLSADPTLHLLGAFFVELGIIWLAVLVYADLHGWSILPAIRPRASLGVTYAGAAFVIPAPTLDVPIPFVLSVLAVGVLALPFRRSTAVPVQWRVPLTALTAVTVAVLSYTVAYLLF